MAFIRRNIELQEAKTPRFHTYQESFRTLDGKVPFSLQVENSFPCHKRDNLVIVSLYAYRIGSNREEELKFSLITHKWNVFVDLFSAASDDEVFESDIPKYAKYAFRNAGDDGSIFSRHVSDPPSQIDLDSIHGSILQLQRLRPCGCGRPAAISVSGDTDFCLECELTLTGTADAVPDDECLCIICMEPIIKGHLSRLNCCGVEMHAGCREEYFDKSHKCPHCREYSA